MIQTDRSEPCIDIGKPLSTPGMGLVEGNGILNLLQHAVFGVKPGELFGQTGVASELSALRKTAPWKATYQLPWSIP